MTTSARHPAATRFGHWLAYAHDVGMAGLVIFAVLVARYHFEPKALPIGKIWQATWTFTLICSAVFPAMRLEQSYWRFTAMNDLSRIAQAVALANVLLVPVLFLADRLQDFPRTGLLIEAPGLILALGFSRLSVRAAHRGDLAAALRFEDRTAPLAVLVGGLEATAEYLADLNRPRGSQYRIGGLISTDPAVRGRMIAGAEVMGGLDQLASLLIEASEIERDNVRVVLTDPRPDRDLVRKVVEVAAETGARVVRRRGTGDALSPIEAADLLARPPRRLDLDRARKLISGRRILITGAGGTIGSELTRQILSLTPSSVALVDASEFNLYTIDQELRALSAAPVWRAELGDVRDRSRMRHLFARHKPEVVVHAAALKHVPLMEAHPAEAVLTNIMGAWIIADLAREYASAMVFISTDKAVNPTNVMGATKRVAEKVVRALCMEGKGEASIVRFGNVLGSSGSVIPLFEKQISEGGPVTVTHPDMIRYFMTVQEAASLVLQAAALPRAAGCAAGVFVLDMGEPVRIEALARELIRLHGLRPDLDIAVRHTGLRPGEKLYEEIFYAAEEVVATEADGVFAAFDTVTPWSDLRGQVKGLIDVAGTRQEAETLRLLKVLEPAFSNPNLDAPDARTAEPVVTTT